MNAPTDPLADIRSLYAKEIQRRDEERRAEAEHEKEAHYIAAFTAFVGPSGDVFRQVERDRKRHELTKAIKAELQSLAELLS